MSEEMIGVSTPIVEQKRTKPPGMFFLTLAVIFPLFVIVFELYTQLCAESLFDPMPTLIHKVLVFLVPLTNLFMWFKLRNNSSSNIDKLLILLAISIGISAYYTLVFLPIMAIGLIAILYFGLGLLPFAPLISLIMASKMYAKLKHKHGKNLVKKKHLLKGFSIALTLLVLLDIPTTATYYGVSLAVSDSAESRVQGIKLLQSLGDKELLLRLSYDGSRRATGILSFITIMLNNEKYVTTSKAREVFYRVTGEPFNIYPVPYSGRGWSRYNDFMFDPDQGGTEVGGRIKGLNLISSRIDGSISERDGLAYLEWVFEFKNDSARQREARIQLALPPNSVVSRVTLWIDGEEREAAFAGRAKTRQAYEKVVRARRDPLLVTTAGTDRILAQAFPITARGGTIKFRIGITAPLTQESNELASLVLPAIIDRNFNITERVKHFLWFEGKHPFSINLPDIESKKITNKLYRVSTSISDKSLSKIRRKVTTKRINSDVILKSIYDGSSPIFQQITNVDRETKDVMLLVVDGSVKVGSSVNGIIASLKNIPFGKSIGLLIAAEKIILVPIDAWSKKQKEKIETALGNFEFVGGKDNLPAIASALQLLEKYENAELLWITSPQPIKFKNTSAVLEQATVRLIRLPHVAMYSVTPGPNKLLDDSQWLLDSNSIPNLGSVENDLEKYFEKSFKGLTYLKYKRYSINPNLIKEGEVGSEEHADSNIEIGSQHIARLWARDQIYSLLIQGKDDDALTLAAKYQLVTAVSGAVVLENLQQFSESDLSPVSKNSVPTIPEPHQWILAFILVVFILWFLKQNKTVLIRQV